MNSSCPLCHSKQISTFQYDMQMGYTYLKCQNCELIFVSRQELLSPDEEHGRYLLHQNQLSDERYLAYGRLMTDFMEPFVQPGFRGLDYGAGPVGLFSFLYDSEGLQVESYDPLFGPKDIRSALFDFVIVHEVAEHFSDPYKEFRRIAGLIKDQGYLFVRTSLVPQGDFLSWSYRRDETHVTFFQASTLNKFFELFGFQHLSSASDKFHAFQYVDRK